METVDLKAAVGNDNGVTHLRIEGSFDGRFPVGDGNRRASHEGELQLVRDLDHAACFREAIGQVFIVEYGNGAAGLSKRLGDFGEELKSRIELLALFIKGIVAMLSDQKHTVDGEAICTDQERL